MHIEYHPMDIKKSVNKKRITFDINKNQYGLNLTPGPNILWGYIKYVFYLTGFFSKTSNILKFDITEI